MRSSNYIKTFISACILLLAPFFFCASSNAQVPGYLGKRFSVHYEPQVWYSFIFERFDLFHNASAEYVITLKHSLGVRYCYTGLSTEFGLVDMPDGIDDLHNVDGLIRSHGITVFGKFFNRKRGFIAPAGGYTSYGAAVVYNKSYAAENKLPLNVGDELEHYTDVILYLGKGRQFIFADRLILNVALQVGVPTVSIFKFKTGLETGDIYSRVFFANLFRAQVGLGFLAF